MTISAVAGIIDAQGGLRVVVGPLQNMHAHVNDGEKLFVVPSLWVQEPVDHGNIYALVSRVEEHIAKVVAPSNHCETCHACCVLPYINDGKGFVKPPNATCTNCKSFGCGAQYNKPQPCKDFQCKWLESRLNPTNIDPPMDDALRPDRCGVIFHSQPGSDQIDIYTKSLDPTQPVPQVALDYEREQTDKGRHFRFVTFYEGWPG